MRFARQNRLKPQQEAAPVPVNCYGGVPASLFQRYTSHLSPYVFNGKISGSSRTLTTRVLEYHGQPLLERYSPKAAFIDEANQYVSINAVDFGGAYFESFLNNGVLGFSIQTEEEFTEGASIAPAADRVDPSLGRHPDLNAKRLVDAVFEHWGTKIWALQDELDQESIYLQRIRLAVYNGYPAEAALLTAYPVQKAVSHLSGRGHPYTLVFSGLEGGKTVFAGANNTLEQTASDLDTLMQSKRLVVDLKPA